MVAYLFRDLSIRTSQEEGKDVCSVVVHPLLCVITYQSHSTASKLAGVLLLTTEVSSLCCVSQVSEQSSGSFCSVNMIDGCYFWSVFEKGLLYETVIFFFSCQGQIHFAYLQYCFPSLLTFVLYWIKAARWVCGKTYRILCIQLWLVGAEFVTISVYPELVTLQCYYFSFPIYFWLCVQWINVWPDGMMTI